MWSIGYIHLLKSHLNAYETDLWFVRATKLILYIATWLPINGREGGSSFPLELDIIFVFLIPVLGKLGKAASSLAFGHLTG